ncbi:MAG: glucokinase [Roseobacter sp.]
MAHPSHQYFLVADIGGTNTRVALSDGTRVLTSTIRRYRNAENESLDAVLREYRAAEDGVTPRAACVAVAGPVRDGKGRLTNLDWAIDEPTLRAATGAQNVALLNDLQAQGYALDHVAEADLLVVKTAPVAADRAAKLVVNLGTGFNASAVFMTPSGPYVSTSESGHANMPVRDARDKRLCDYIAAKHGFAAIDDVLSGRGLARIYDFLSAEAGEDRTLNSADVMQACETRSDPVAVATVRYFTELTAMVVGNLALIQLPFGGIYFVGGLSGAIAPYFELFEFNKAFRDKGRFASFMDDFGISVVQDDYAALKGAAAYLGTVSQGVSEI